MKSSTGHNFLVNFLLVVLFGSCSAADVCNTATTSWTAVGIRETIPWAELADHKPDCGADGFIRKIQLLTDAVGDNVAIAYRYTCCKNSEWESLPERVVNNGFSRQHDLVAEYSNNVLNLLHLAAECESGVMSACQLQVSGGSRQYQAECGRTEVSNCYTSKSQPTIVENIGDLTVHPIQCSSNYYLRSFYLDNVYQAPNTLYHYVYSCCKVVSGHSCTNCAESGQVCHPGSNTCCHPDVPISQTSGCDRFGTGQLKDHLGQCNYNTNCPEPYTCHERSETCCNASVDVSQVARCDKEGRGILAREENACDENHLCPSYPTSNRNCIENRCRPSVTIEIENVGFGEEVFGTSAFYTEVEQYIREMPDIDGDRIRIMQTYWKVAKHATDNNTTMLIDFAFWGQRNEQALDVNYYRHNWLLHYIGKHVTERLQDNGYLFVQPVQTSVIIGGVVLVALFILLAVFMKRRRDKSSALVKERESRSSPLSSSEPERRSSAGDDSVNIDPDGSDSELPLAEHEDAALQNEAHVPLAQVVVTV